MKISDVPVLYIISTVRLRKVLRVISDQGAFDGAYERFRTISLVLQFYKNATAS